jgi:hypothetical protein
MAPPDQNLAWRAACTPAPYTLPANAAWYGHWSMGHGLRAGGAPEHGVSANSAGARARAQVRALRALYGMTAMLAQGFGAARDLDADLATLQRGDLPPDARAATMLIAAKQRMLNAAAHELARALQARAAPAVLPHACPSNCRRPAAVRALPGACWRARGRTRAPAACVRLPQGRRPGGGRVAGGPERAAGVPGARAVKGLTARLFLCVLARTLT